MKLQGINHLCFSVSDLAKSIDFYQKVFDAKLMVAGRTLAYFDLNGLWLALNQEEVERSLYPRTYTHIAFTIEEGDWNKWMDKLVQAGAEVLPGRERDERDQRSVYFLDPDGHRFEFHTGTLADRIDYYKADKPHMQFFD
ncbi:metallothiol transferase [Fontibacillus phaseoli]|uniref:Metallothiol transferase FosB n=1 Tax=Fontibacillus phaseoli TaxID=1416533 RepID=A0A369B653_9BACL|nr:metallothiol transferase FosB [Fontibacillus phaseoli]RCX16990.1 metallothiol transferase [Fontibacillus phaseoli]